jgi:hypothetical protein
MLKSPVINVGNATKPLLTAPYKLGARYEKALDDAIVLFTEMTPPARLAVVFASVALTCLMK